ncbi:MAG TPA: response regulator [Opitutaceae bacterium]|nr:response regulator [Opitutaceae bacterium]
MSADGQFPWEIALILGTAAAAVLWLQRMRARALIDTAAEARAEELEAATARAAHLQRELGEAKTTIRTQNDLLAQLSREVRGHMDGIIGSANLLLDTKLPSSQRQQLITLRATGESLLYVLGDVQAIVQAEISAVRNEHAPFELRQEIAHVFEVLAPRAALKNVEVSLIIAPEVPRRLVGDVPLMRQFFFNLLASALRLTPAGSIILRVERTVGPGELKAPARTWLRFAVTDATHLQAALAVPTGSQNPFATTARSALETSDNLALTVARRQVGILGGRFGEATTTERGPEIWFDLPLEAAAAVAQPAMDTAATDSFVVVFDDLPSARVAASNLLAEMGVEHDVAKSAAEAIEALGDAVQAHAGPLVLLLDESISIQDLGTLVNAFRDQPDLRNVKVVLMSLRPDKASLDMAVPVRAVLQKPLLLPREVLEAFETARTATGPARPSEPSLSQPPFPAGERSALPHVLLVEDNEVSRQVCETMLKRMGCRVDLAGDGVEAVDRAKRREYDLIFMDCWMPRLDGYAAARQIREALGAKAPPIIALTADDLQENRVKAEKSGMVDFMVKPASRAEFTRVFSRWLKGKSLAGSTPPT